MEQPAGSFPSDRRLIGRIIIAVILGEAIWALIVSVMNNLVVPWLGDVMGQSSGLPTSFVQRPYNYPELFVSILEVCIAGLVAAILNYFVQRPQVRRVKSMKSSVAAGPVQIFAEPAKTLVPAEVFVARSSPPQPRNQTVQDATPHNQIGLASAASPIAPEAPAPVAQPQPVPTETSASEVKAAPVTPPVPTPAASAPAKPVPPPKTGVVKPKKPKEVYYNIVGERMPSDDD